MKRYIRNSTEELHLKDILKRILFVWYEDDLPSSQYESITSSANFEREFYLSLPDDKLLETEAKHLSRLTDPAVLDKIASLDKTKLTAKQLKILEKKYSEKVVVDRTDVEAFLDVLKKCTRVSLERHVKTETFRAEYNLSEHDILEILQLLEVVDYTYNSRSINYTYLGNALMIFQKKGPICLSDNVLPAITIYIKLDIDKTTGDGAAVISIHEAERNEKHLYKK